MSIDRLWIIPKLATGIFYLERIGAKAGTVKAASTAAEIVGMVPRDGSVVIIAVHLIKGSRVIAKHAVYAFKNTVLHEAPRLLIPILGVIASKEQ
jgi:hypothetical protein